MAVHALFKDASGRSASAGRATTLSSQIVAEVREALFEKRLAPGDFLGSEKDIAARSGVSRIVARDALRTLEALGVVDIKVGSGGGARIARGNPQLFAEALAVQLELTGVAVGEIMDAQRAIEGAAAELAARQATPQDHARLAQLVDQAALLLDDGDGFTRASRDFHIGVAAASHNRVLVFQLVSLQHVSWPRRNRTLSRDVAQHVLGTHRELVRLIAGRDAAAARALMDDHVKMIRARRVAEHAEAHDTTHPYC